VTTKPEGAIANALVDDMAMKFLECELAVAAADGEKDYHPEMDPLTSLEYVHLLVRIMPTGRVQSGQRAFDEGDEHDTTRFSGAGMLLSRRCTEFSSARDAAAFYLYTASKKNTGSTMAGGGLWPPEEHMSATTLMPMYYS
jgi:hypothetical protein